jgi:ABC-type multidrug transport system ATPase subunit
VSAQPIIEVRQLTKYFDGAAAVDHLSFEVIPGEVFGLLGSNGPEILFLDEPTASLDPDIAHKVRATLRHMQQERGVTIVYTSHNMREIDAMCHRVIFLARGKMVTQGTPQEVVSRAHSTSLEEVFITIARDGRLQDITEVKENDGCGCG